jgi:hypothetical protein
MSPETTVTSQPSPPEPAAQRPVWVWIIAIYYTLSAGFTLLSYIVIASGVLLLTPEHQVYPSGLGPFDYIASVGVGILTLIAAVLLVLLKKTAVLLFGASLCLKVGLMLVILVKSNWVQTLGGSGLIGAFAGWALLGAVTFYSRRLRQLGVLR